MHVPVYFESDGLKQFPDLAKIILDLSLNTAH